MTCNRLKWILVVIFFLVANGQETGLPDYVVSECYGDIFSFDCGAGNKIRINRDFFGYSQDQSCRYSRGDCIISNPKSNSLIHRYCTGHRVCTYYLVERRGCGGAYSNYQQVEYQCIPDTKITNICETAKYETTSTYIASPNFPENYPPNVDCRCVVSSTDPDSKVQLEVVYLAVKYTWPCKDWLQIGRRRTCGTNVDLYQGRTIPISFHSDKDESHSGFWLHFQSSGKGSKILVRCGNATQTPPPPVTRKPPTPPPEEPSTTTESGRPESEETEPTTLPPPGEDDEQKPEAVSNDRGNRPDEENNFQTDDSIDNNRDLEPKRDDNAENGDEDERRTDLNPDSNTSLQPTVPPNLPFGDIRRPGNKVNPSNAGDASNNDRNNPEQQTDTSEIDGVQREEQYDSNLISGPTSSTDKTQDIYPSSKSESDHSVTGTNSPESSREDTALEDGSSNSGGSVQEETTEASVQFYPDETNDITRDKTETSTATTTTATTITTTTTTTNGRKKSDDENDNENKDAPHDSRDGPSLDVWSSEDYKSSNKHGEEAETNSPDQDITDSRNNAENQSENMVDPDATYFEYELPNGKSNTGNEKDESDESRSYPSDTPPSENQDENVSKHDSSENQDENVSKHDSSENQNENVSKHDSNVKQPPVPVSIDDYEDEVNYIDNYDSEDNDQTPVENISNMNKNLGSSKDIVHGRETGPRVPDIRNIHSIHEVNNGFDTKGHPVDFNLPGVTGGNFTFNSTATNQTVITKATKEEDGGIITLGLIILCICIGVGILLVVCVLLAIYCRRKRRTRDDETQTSGGNTKAKKTIVVVGVDQDGDSGQGLLVIGNGHVKGNGHGHGHTRRKNVVGPLEHPMYNRPKRADKSMQIDFDSESEYGDVMMYNRDYTLEDMDSDVSSVQSSTSPFNNKCVQVRTSRPYMTTARPNGHGAHGKHGGHGRLSMSPARHALPMSPGRPPRPPVSPPRHGVPPQLKRSHGIDGIIHQINQKPLPPRRPPSRHAVDAAERNTSVGIDVNYIINDIHVEPTHGYNVQRRKHSMYRINDSDVDSFTGSDTDAEKIKRESLASMSELAEMTMSPENTMDSRQLDYNSDSDGSDWDQRSAISI